MSHTICQEQQASLNILLTMAHVRCPYLPLTPLQRPSSAWRPASARSRLRIVPVSAIYGLQNN